MDHPQKEIYWLFHFTICTMVGALTAPDRLSFISGGACNSDDPEELVQRLTRFISGGVRADPAPLLQEST